MDIRLSGGSGIEACRNWIMALLPQTRVITHFYSEMVFDAIGWDMC